MTTSASTVSATIDETRRYFDERVVPAGQPVSFHCTSNRCYTTFRCVPKAGADYGLCKKGGDKRQGSLAFNCEPARPTQTVQKNHRRLY